MSLSCSSSMVERVSMFLYDIFAVKTQTGKSRCSKATRLAVLVGQPPYGRRREFMQDNYRAGQ